MLRITFHAATLTRPPIGPTSIPITTLVAPTSHTPTPSLSSVLAASSVSSVCTSMYPSPTRSSATSSHASANKGSFLGLQHRPATRLKGLLKDAKKNTIDHPEGHLISSNRPHQHDRLTREIQHVKRVYDELVLLVSWPATQRLLRESQIPTTESILKKMSKKQTPVDTQGSNVKGREREQEQDANYQSISDTTSSTITNVAHIAQATAFSPSTMAPGNEYHIHDRSCQVASGDVPLTALWTLGEGRGGDSCTHCLRRRVHHLANEHFCYSMAWNSTLKGSMEGMDWESMKDSGELKEVIIDSFGSVGRMKETIGEFARNRRVSGFTWLVFNPNYIIHNNNGPTPPVSLINNDKNSNTTSDNDEGGINKTTATNTPAVKRGRLEVVNLPGNMIPNVIGMWPISCFNMTNFAITEVFQDVELERKHPRASSSSREAASPHPPWSRAARSLTAAAISQSVPVPDGPLSGNGLTSSTNPDGGMASNGYSDPISLTALRARAIASQLSCWNPLTAYSQIVEAIMMFRSQSFTDAVKSRKEAHVASAQAAVLKRYENVSVEGVFRANKQKESRREEQEERNHQKEAVSDDTSTDPNYVGKGGIVETGTMEGQQGDDRHSHHMSASQTLSTPTTVSSVSSDTATSVTDEALPAEGRGAVDGPIQSDTGPVSASSHDTNTSTDSPSSVDNNTSSVQSTQSADDGQSTIHTSTGAEAGDEVVDQGICEDATTRYYTRSNGICSYHFANGTVTEVYPDGRQVTMMEGSTTTAYPDGSTHCLYSNGATIEVRADGTRYVNGELSQE